MFGLASTVCNILYFRSEKYQLHTAETSTRHLYKMLNFFDLVVCAATVFFLLHGELLLFPEEFKIPSGYWLFHLVLRSSVHVTGFITCMLVITRFINTVWTAYLLDCFAMTIAAVLYSFVAVSLEVGPYIFGTGYDVAFILQFALLTSIFLVVIVFNVVILTKLNTVQSEEHDTAQRRHTTHTVMVLSCIYCLCNLGNLVVLVDNIAGDSFTVPVVLSLISTYIVLPLKSACNPMVYVVRPEEMRTRLRHTWKKLTMGDEASDKELQQLSSRKEQISRRRNTGSYRSGRDSPRSPRPQR